MSAQIPSTAGLDIGIRKVIDPLKECVETITGRRGTKITSLPSTATNADIINKVNEIITRLQG